MTVEDKSSIETLLKSHKTALNAGDTNAIMDLLGVNPGYIIQNSRATVGRDAVRKQTDQTFKAVKFDVHLTLH